MISSERVGTEIGIMTGRIKQSFRNGKDNISSFQTNLGQKTRRAARQTDYYVHDNAWMMMAMSAGLAWTPSSCASNTGQPARFWTIVLGNLRPSRSR